MLLSRWLEPRDDLAGHTQALALFNQAEVTLDITGNETHRDAALTRASRATNAMHVVCR
jgi:hypothetical protein